MKFVDDKKDDILLYILEKIKAGEPALSKTVSENFDINQNTVHRYLNELLEKGSIKRVKRGRYELVKNLFVFDLKRQNGDLDDDTKAFDRCLEPLIKELPRNIRDSWSYSFSEMTNNVMDHSHAENFTVTVEQDELSTLAILRDDGIGIFNNIQSHFGFETVEDAVCELFKGKLTTDPKNHSGEGIFFSSKIMDNFAIVSDGKLFGSNKFGDNVMKDGSTGEPGTTVIMELSNRSRREPKDAFDLYADVDGGFTRTVIPLKRIFDSSPVSRSQAKRVCNRLDSFKEVTVDFDGIDWVGQGFAHQIFSVFAKAHPEISIKAVNTSEDVQKMINHVEG